MFKKALNVLVESNKPPLKTKFVPSNKKRRNCHSICLTVSILCPKNKRKSRKEITIKSGLTGVAEDAIGGLLVVAIVHLRERIPQIATSPKQKRRANQSVTWCTRDLNKKRTICANHTKTERFTQTSKGSGSSIPYPDNFFPTDGARL